MKSRILFVLPFALFGVDPAVARDNQEFPVQWKVGTTYVQSMKMAQEMTLPMGQGGMQIYPQGEGREISAERHGFAF